MEIAPLYTFAVSVGLVAFAIYTFCELHKRSLRQAFGQKTPVRVRANYSSNRGVTLVETMMSVMCFCIGMLGVYMMMIKAYELTTLARYRDNARAVLVTFADQFERLQTTDLVGSTIVTRALFQETDPPTGAGPTGLGLTWVDAQGNTYTGTANGLNITLGDSSSASIPAVVLHQTTGVNTSGVDVGNQGNTAAGRLLQGVFTITYTVHGHTQTESITIARSVL